MVDVSFTFNIIDVGAYSKSSDRGLFTRSVLGKFLEASALHFPNSKPPHNSEELLCHVIVSEFQSITMRTSKFITRDRQAHVELL